MKALSCEISVPARNKIKTVGLQRSERGDYEAGDPDRDKTVPAPEGHVKNCDINPHT